MKNSTVRIARGDDLPRRVGVFREVGRMFDRTWDVPWMEKSLAPRRRNDGP
jgi:hypothetical protein